ncbi:MAG: hypothetical protein Kow0049_01340 [Stanieria sp.]
MLSTEQKNAQNHASLSRKIYLFVRERTFTELIKEIWHNGLPLFRRLVGLYFDKKFDRKYNVDTCGSIHLHQLTVKRKNIESCSIYDPIPAKTLRNLFRYLPKNLSEYNFIDFGSGKGRAILVAAEYPFRQIIGVEFAQELDEVTWQNIHNYSNPKQKCFDLSSMCMDAVEFEIPQGKCIFFFFVPFGADIFSEVLKNIHKSYTQHPREMLILYVTDPKTHPYPYGEIIEGCGLFAKVREGYFSFEISQRDNLYYKIYQTTNS